MMDNVSVMNIEDGNRSWVHFSRINLVIGNVIVASTSRQAVNVKLVREAPLTLVRHALK